VSQAYVVARLCGEMQAADIPLSQAVSQAQLDALLNGDDDPLQVVIEVAPGKSSRGWHYTEPALQKLVGHVEQRSLAGIMGHQRDEDMSHEFRTPVTHWVGAKWDQGKAYFRGVVDKAAPDLKRWIRAGRVTQPSIFTRPTLARNARGEQEVVDLEPLGIDWAPLDRAGMSSARIVAWGELADGESSGTPGGTTTPQGGTRHMERSEVIGEFAGLSGSPLTNLADAAERNPAFRPTIEAVRASGEMETLLGKPPAEHVALVRALLAERDALKADLTAIGEMDGKPYTEARAVAAGYKQRGDDLQTTVTTVRAATIAPRVHALAEAKFPGDGFKFQRQVFEDELNVFVQGKDVDTTEKLEAVAGEMLATPPWKARMETVGTTSTTINPATSRTSQNGSSGPDMSVFGASHTPISA